MIKKIQKIVLRFRSATTFFKYISNKKPIIIVGNQKTGSTAIACLLSKATGESLSSDFFEAFETSGQQQLFIGNIPLKKVIRQYWRAFSKKIIKELTLVFWLDQIISYFPKAQFVLIIRDPRDNIRSILNRLDIPGNLTDLPQQTFEQIPELAWRHIVNGSIYGTQGATYIATLANRWVFMLNQYEKYRSKVHLVRYEDFIVDKKAYIDQLSRKLGLTSLHDISDSVDAQYQPKGNHSVNWHQFFGPENLLLIEKICSDKMTTYGYIPTILK